MTVHRSSPQPQNMQQELIAPCGMNCALCTSYLALKNDLKKKGFGKTYCPGCRPRGKNCAFLKKHCQLLGDGLVRFCYECKEFPCRRLKTLDKRYSTFFHMSMIDNLEYIREQGIERFLGKEEEKWKCPDCGRTICCHNGICYACGLEKLKGKKHQCRWDEG